MSMSVDKIADACIKTDMTWLPFAKKIKIVINVMTACNQTYPKIYGLCQKVLSLKD